MLRLLFKLWLRLFCLVIILLPFAVGEDKEVKFQVIVHVDNPLDTLTDRDLLRIFLKKKTRLPGGLKVVPVDLIPDSPTRKFFSEQILHKPVHVVRAYWQKKVFTGRAIPPPELETSSAVATYIHNHAEAIGYVGLNTDLSDFSVKVITILAD